VDLVALEPLEALEVLEVLEAPQDLRPKELTHSRWSLRQPTYD